MNKHLSKSYPQWSEVYSKLLKERYLEIEALQRSISNLGKGEKAYKVIQEWLELKAFDNDIVFEVRASGSLDLIVRALPSNTFKQVEDFYQDLTTLLFNNSLIPLKEAPHLYWGGSWYNVVGTYFGVDTLYLTVSWEFDLTTGLADYKIETSRTERTIYDTNYKFVPRAAYFPKKS